LINIEKKLFPTCSSDLL